MRLFAPLLAWSVVVGAQDAYAQFSAQKDAQYIATLKAVVNYKINDEENLKDIESLRQNQAFNQKLQNMLNKLQNTRTKNTTNRKVQQILEKAGQDLYRLLD
ncbi:MAG: hypothetical protein OSJ76_07035 [Alphaproteobacteria bacterium]|nr:hypothetical protein [Alphaproteobacteria bacterium]